MHVVVSSLVALLFAIFNISAETSPVIISEFLAFNVSTYPDMHDYDDFSDWIELYNTSDSSVDLSGYFITDNLSNPTKWPFPPGVVIAAKSFLILRADGMDAKPGTDDTLESYPWSVTFTTKRYHTNFKLSEEGDEIGLYKQSGTRLTTVDSVIFSNQLADVSLGRKSDELSAWYKFDLPTPGSANTSDAKTVEISSGPVSFSIPGGFYPEVQTVSLTSATGDIYYTLDGSIPTTKSLKYTSPLTLNTTTVIRARSIEPSRLAGKVSTNTYFINEKTRTLMVASITTDTSLLYNSETGIFTNSFKNREVPITLELFTPDGQQVVKVNAGMTIGSLTNFTCPQKPLQIALKGRKYGDDFIWYRLFDKEISCFGRIRMRQGGDGWKSNLIADGMLEAMGKDQLEFGIQAYHPVVLFINGTYYGIQDMREQFDDQYFTNNYNVDPTTKEEVRSTIAPLPGKLEEIWEVVDGTWDNYGNLISSVTSGEVTSEKYAMVKEQINLNSFIDFISAVVFGSQISWGHNEDVWKVNSTKWQWLVTDFDRCFAYKRSLSDVKLNNFTKSAGMSGSLMEQDTLFFSLIRNTEFKNYFVQRFSAHLNSTFHPSRMNGIIDSLARQLEPEMDDYTNKWGPEGGVQSLSTWKQEIENVKFFCTKRPGYVFDFFTAEPFNMSGTCLLSIKLSIPLGGTVYINDVRMCSWLDSLRFVKDVPLHVRVVPASGYVFTGWDDGSIGETLTVTLTGDRKITANFRVAAHHTILPIIKENTTFSLTDNPYVAAGDIVVEKGATLTIEKGVTILMHQDADIIVRGRLLVHGTADEKVCIQHNEDAGAVNWGALNFDTAQDTNYLSHLTISGTTNGNDPLTQRGGINGNGSMVIIDHLTMFNSIYPLYFEYGSTTIRDSRVTVEHICNGAIHIGRGNAIVENNFWLSTGVTINTDAIDIKGVENGIVRGNLIYNFNGFNSDAIDLGESAKNILVSNNIIYGSYDKGISIGGKSTATIVNNLIVNCDLGIGIKDDFSYADIDHNTLVRNRIGIATYSKAFGRGGGAATVTNTIIASSKSRSFFEDRYSSISFDNCLSDVDLLPGNNNISVDPGFVDIIQNDYQLVSTSPCIDRGLPSHALDADGTITDIGAQYTYNVTHFPDTIVPAFTPQSVVFNEIMYKANKNNAGNDWIELYNPTKNEISLVGWKLTDKGDYCNWINSIDIQEVDSSDIFFFPDNAKIGAQSYCVLVRDPAGFSSVDSGVAILGVLPFSLDEQETLLLYDSKNSLVNALTYKNSNPWPLEPDGNGSSLELIDANRFNFHPSNWASSKCNGTPGRKNSVSEIIYDEAPKIIPQSFALSRCFPNPCKVKTTLQFALPEQCHVSIELYSISGIKVATLLDGDLLAGYHPLSIDLRHIAPGIYLYKVSAKHFVRTRKLTIQ